MTDIPKPTGGDVAHLIARAGLGSIPVLGAAALELFNAVIEPPLVRRRDAWLISLAEKVAFLTKNVDGFNVEALKDNDAFVTTVLHATQAAIRAHQQEKIDALRCAVLNTALHRGPSDDLQLMFLHLIDRFTPWHLRILRLFDEHPTNWQSLHASGNLYEFYPELHGQEELFKQIVRDLYSSGLVVSNVTPGTATAYMPYAGHATEMGQEFLKFITSPVEIEKDN